MVSLADANNFTLTLTLTSLAAISCTNALDLLKVKGKKGRKKKLLAFAICGIACLHYVFLRQTNNILVRYSDWYVTCPLMFLEFALLLEVDVSRQIVPLLVGLLGIFGMLTCGLYAENNTKNQVLIVGIGFVFLAVMYASLFHSYTHQENQKRNCHREVAVLFFSAVWMFYGAAFFLRGDQQSVAFNILDFVSKVGLGSYVLLL